MSRASVGHLLFAVIVSYLGFGLLVVVTEEILSLVTTHSGARSPAYFVLDLITQCLYLIAAGYVCSAIARTHRLAIALLTALGLLVGTFSLVTSWNSEPRWYGIALLVTYAPFLLAGWALRRRAIAND